MNITQETKIQMSRERFLESLLVLLVENLSFNDFLEKILLLLIQVLPSEAGSILEADYDGQIAFFRAAYGPSAERVKKFTIPFGHGLIGQVIETGQTVSTINSKQEKVHLRYIEKAVDFSARNLIAAPIQIQQKIFGVVELINRVDAESFSAEDSAQLNLYCASIGRAIEVQLSLLKSKA